MSIAYAYVLLCLLFMALAFSEIALGAYSVATRCANGSDLHIVIFLCVIWVPDVYEIILGAHHTKQAYRSLSPSSHGTPKRPLWDTVLTPISRIAMTGISAYGAWAVSAINYKEAHCGAGLSTVALSLVYAALHIFFVFIVLLVCVSSPPGSSARVAPREN